jgi:nitrate reductase gamma subunit
VFSIEEFNAASKAHTRRLVIAMAVSIAGTFACFGVTGLVREFFLYPDRSDFVAEIVLMAIMLVGVLVFLGGTWIGYRRGYRDVRLHCPHCHTMLFERRHLVIATRNCYSCGRRVLAEPE